MREDESEAAKIDADLDAKEIMPNEPVADAAKNPAMRPWWEEDPRFTGRFKSG